MLTDCDTGKFDEMNLTDTVRNFANAIINEAH